MNSSILSAEKLMMLKVAAIGLLLCLSATVESADNKLSWYIIGGVGQVAGSGSANQLTEELLQIGVRVEQLSVDDNRSGWQVKFGYEINQSFALEVGFIDLGDVAIELIAEVVEPEVFIVSVNKIHPNSANGYSMGGVYRYSLYNSLSLDAYTGLFVWQGGFDSRIANMAQKISSRDSGIDAYFGLGANYQMSDHVAFSIKWERYQLDNESSDMLSLNWLYYFNFP